MEFLESKPVNKLLHPFIDGYMQVRWNNGQVYSKDLMPRLGASMIFNFKELRTKSGRNFDNAVIGFRNEPFGIEARGNEVDCFIIIFSSYGLSRFTETPQDQLTNRIVAGELVLSSDIHDLQDQLYQAYHFSQRVKFVEKYLLKKLRFPTKTNDIVFHSATILKEKIESVSPGKLKKEAPLSPRQLERQFKSLIGVNMQTFIRICRFDTAKNLLINSYSSTLTETGYSAGYYDQAHFSKEFKILSNLNPKNFLQRSPFYQFLAHDEQEIFLT